MKITFTKISFLILLVFSIACNQSTDKTDFNIKGNWSVIEDSSYFEYYFADDTLEIFDKEWEFYPPKLYSIHNDSLIVKLVYGDSATYKFKIDVIDSLNFNLIDSGRVIQLTKISNDQFTIKDLFSENYLYLGTNNPKTDFLKTKFIDSNFSIREANYLIDNKILNKDSLLSFWNKLANDSSSHSDYYKYLIDNIK